MPAPRKSKQNVNIFVDPSCNKENINPSICVPRTDVRPTNTKLQYNILAQIVAGRQALRQQRSLREQQRLIDLTSFAVFFGKRVQVAQHEINQYCGMPDRTALNIRHDLSVYQKLKANKIQKDPRGGWNRKLTVLEIRRIDEAMENDRELCIHSWKVIARECGIRGHCTQVLRSAMQDLGWCYDPLP